MTRSRAFMVELDEPWEPGEYEIAELIDYDNDKVVMHVQRHVRGRTSGVEADFDYWLVGTARWEGRARGMVRPPRAGARGRKQVGQRMKRDTVEVRVRGVPTA
jgi:hypothetical protein